MKAQDMLLKAADTIKQRGEQNGYDKKEERSAAQIVALFNGLTGKDLTEADGWLFLQLLKLVRIQRQIINGSGDITDSFIDMTSYGVLRAEAVLAGLPSGAVSGYWSSAAKPKLPVPKCDPGTACGTVEEKPTTKICEHRYVKRLKTSKELARAGKVQVCCEDCGHEFAFQLDGGQTLTPAGGVNYYEIVNDGEVK